MADNLNSIEQRYAIKFMQKEGETFTNVYTRLRAAEITMLALMTLSEACKRGLSKRLPLSSRKA